MNVREISTAICIVGMLAGTAMAQQTAVMPLQGQSSQQVQKDTTDCQAAANSPASAAAPAAGGRVRGAPAGAAAGAAAAEVRGRQYDAYDNVSDEAKQDYRRNQAEGAAAAGAVVGASRQRQQRREAAAQSGNAYQQAFKSCMQGRGYQVSP